jgi:hypothetical protein
MWMSQTLYNTIIEGMNIHKSQLFWCAENEADLPLDFYPVASSCQMGHQNGVLGACMRI